MLPELCK